MAVTLVQGNPVRTNAFSGSSTPGLAYSSAVTAGNTLIMSFSGNTGQTVSSVDDDVNSGAWTQAVGRTTGNAANVYIYYKLNTSSGTPTVTAHLSGASSGCQITLYEISGSSLGFDVQNSNGGTTGGVSDAGNLNTTFANAILIAQTENTGAESTLGSSFTAFLQSANGNFFAGAQYRIVSATSNYATAFATDTGSAWDTVAAAFGEAAASDTLMAQAWT